MCVSNIKAHLVLLARANLFHTKDSRSKLGLWAGLEAQQTVDLETF